MCGRILLIATGSVATVKIPALAVALTELTASPAQIKILTSAAGIWGSFERIQGSLERSGLFQENIGLF